MSLLLAGGMLAYLVAWLLGTDTGTQRQRLPDGSTLSLLGYTYGQKHEFLTGPRWQKLLFPAYGRLPEFVKERMDGLTRIYRTDPPPGLLTVWAWRTGPSPPSIERRFSAVDEHGCELWSQNYGAYGVGPGGIENLEPLAIEIFPRRALEMRVRAYQEVDQYHGRRLAEIIVRNPDSGPHSDWRVPSLPQSVPRDGRTFTLERLVTGLRPNEKTGAVPNGEIPCSRFDYRVSRSGHMLGDWTATRMEWSDATGNHAEAFIRVAVAAPRTARWYAWQGGLCTHEPYRLHVEFSSDRILDISDTWSLPNIPIPPRGVVRPVDWSAERRGSQLHVSQIAGPGAKLEGWAHLDNSWPKAAFLVLTDLRSGVSDRLRLVRAADSRGRNLMPDRLEGRPVSYSTNGEAIFAVRSYPGTRSVNLTFGLRRSYFVEFVARPIPASGEAKSSR